MIKHRHIWLRVMTLYGKEENLFFSAKFVGGYSVTYPILS